MKNISIAFLTALVLLTGLNSCKKYDDGPGISFRSKFDRVVNTWKPKNVFRDEADFTAWFTDLEVDLMEDGRFVISDKDDLDSTFTSEGFWDLVSDNEQLRFVISKPPTNPDRKFYDILRLKEDELWYKEVTDSVVWTFRLIPASTAADTTQ